MKEKSYIMKKIGAVLLVLTMIIGCLPATKTTAYAATTATSITVNDDFIVLQGTGASAKINASASDGSVITYTSSNQQAATVTADGNVTAVNAGLADVTLQAGDTTKIVKVTVVPVKNKANRVKVAVQMFNMAVGGDLANWGMDATKDQIVDIIRSVAASGYDGVEWANLGGYAKQFYGIDPAELKGIMDELRLETAAVHYHLPWLDGSTISMKEIIDTNIALGNDEIIFAYSTPSTFGEGTTNAQWSEKINAVLKSMQEAAKGTGITVLYHNHGAEFTAVSNTDSTYVMDTLKPDAFEVDVYWASSGMGTTKAKNIQKAINYITKNASKIDLLHIKDGNQYSGVTTDMTTWGIGNFPIQKIVNVARANNIEWVVVEDDRPIALGVKDAALSMRYIQNNIKLNFISDIVKAKVTAKSTLTYTGSDIKPSITVKYNGVTLEKGKDYTISYKNNKKVGKATIIINGTGDYKGTKKVTFNIVSQK